MKNVTFRLIIIIDNLINYFILISSLDILNKIGLPIYIKFFGEDSHPDIAHCYENTGLIF